MSDVLRYPHPHACISFYINLIQFVCIHVLFSIYPYLVTPSCCMFWQAQNTSQAAANDRRPWMAWWQAQQPDKPKQTVSAFSAGQIQDITFQNIFKSNESTIQPKEMPTNQMLAPLAACHFDTQICSTNNDYNAPAMTDSSSSSSSSSSLRRTERAWLPPHHGSIAQYNAQYHNHEKRKLATWKQGVWFHMRKANPGRPKPNKEWSLHDSCRGFPTTLLTGKVWSLDFLGPCRILCGQILIKVRALLKVVEKYWQQTNVNAQNVENHHCSLPNCQVGVSLAWSNRDQIGHPLQRRRHTWAETSEWTCLADLLGVNIALFPVCPRLSLFLKT